MNVSSISNFALSTWSAATKGQVGVGLPVHLTVEPTNICNLRCPVCETGAKILERPVGTMTFDSFKKILDAVGPQVNTLLLYYMGEPFLNKELPQMMSYTVKKGIYVSVCTNGEFVNAEETIDSEVSEVSFQIGGLSQATHGVYRVNGDFSRTINNLRSLLDEKRRRGAKTKVIVGFIVMKHNERELPGLSELKRLGVDSVQVIAPCVRTVAQGREFLPTDDKYWYYNRALFGKGVLRPRVVPHNRCWWIYYSTVVTWDGDVLPCCRDARGTHSMGNVLTDKFKDIWNGRGYREFRAAIATKQADMQLCKLCSGYGFPRLY